MQCVCVIGVEIVSSSAVGMGMEMGRGGGEKKIVAWPGCSHHIHSALKAPYPSITLLTRRERLLPERLPPLAPGGGDGGT